MSVLGKKAPRQLASSLSLRGSDADLVVYCQPCHRDGPRLAAHGYCKNCCEHLCESCYKHHKKHTLSKDHILQDGNSMPQSLQPPPKGNSKPNDEVTKLCPKHKKEAIKFFCNDHEALICIICFTLGHQSSSCNVSYISDISENVIDGKDYQDILKTMQNILDRFHKRKDDVNSASQNSNVSLKHVLKNIKKFRNEINQRIDKLEKQIEDKVKDIQRENSVNLQKTETICNDATSSLQKSFVAIKQLNQAKQADGLFIEVKCAEKMITDYERTLVDIANSDAIECDFKPNVTLSNLLTKEKSLGTLVHKIKSRSFSRNGEVCVKTTSDTKLCCITGITVLTPDILIVADYYNRTVKMVDTSRKTVTDQLQNLASFPYDITMVTGTELAVTLPYMQMIQFITTTANKLTKSNSVKVDGNCYGISCHQSKLVVTFCSSAKLQILDMNGTVLSTFEDESFIEPFYVVTNSMSIYVSDVQSQTVTRLNWEGAILSSYSGMDEPTGLVLSENGTVFVCDRKRNVIEEISGDCSTGNVMLNDLKNPQTLCRCINTRKLNYSCDSISPKYDNVLHVYKLS